MVDLPEPDSPTKATVRPAGTTKLRSDSTVTLVREGYAKATLRNSSWPWTVGSSAPGASSSMAGFLHCSCFLTCPGCIHGRCLQPGMQGKWPSAARHAGGIEAQNMTDTKPGASDSSWSMQDPSPPVDDLKNARGCNAACLEHGHCGPSLACA